MLVRARTKGDLERLIERIPGATAFKAKIFTIEDDPKADYRWRLIVNRKVLSEWLLGELADTDYTTSVKTRLDQGDPVRHGAMMSVWSAMMRLQKGGAYAGWGSWRKPETVGQTALFDSDQEHDLWAELRERELNDGTPPSPSEVLGTRYSVSIDFDVSRPLTDNEVDGIAAAVEDAAEAHADADYEVLDIVSWWEEVDGSR